MSERERFFNTSEMQGHKLKVSPNPRPEKTREMESEEMREESQPKKITEG